jgi:hypothetical protein
MGGDLVAEVAILLRAEPGELRADPTTGPAPPSAEMSTSSARISMHEAEYLLTLSRPCRRSLRSLFHRSGRKSDRRIWRPRRGREVAGTLHDMRGGCCPLSIQDNGAALGRRGRGLPGSLHDYSAAGGHHVWPGTGV